MTTEPNNSSETGEERLVGVWELVDARTISVETGESEPSYGEGARGFIHYTDTGRMMALITHGGRSLLDGDRQSSPAEQKVAAYNTSMAYAGRYFIDGDKVIHRIEAATYPNWVGTDLIRYFRFEDDRVVLVTAPQPQNGVIATLEIEWCRCP